MTAKNDQSIFEKIEKYGIPIPSELKEKISKKLDEMRSYTPKEHGYASKGNGEGRS